MLTTTSDKRLVLTRHECKTGGPLGTRFFFSFRTALKDRPRELPTANHQPPPTANCQRRPTANRQPLPTTTSHQSPTTNRRQPPPTATNRQPPIATNRQSPPTMVEHMSYMRSFCKTTVLEHFFFLLRTTMVQKQAQKQIPADASMRLRKHPTSRLVVVGPTASAKILLPPTGVGQGVCHRGSARVPIGTSGVGPSGFGLQEHVVHLVCPRAVGNRLLVV